MKRHWDAVVASLGLALGVAAMAGLLVTEEFAHAAGAEARGYDALFHVVADAEACPPGAGAGMQTVLVASNEVTR
jgi:Flp pilus assembly protein CpaB